MRTLLLLLLVAPLRTLLSLLLLLINRGFLLHAFLCLLQFPKQDDESI
jgi:hypothetical protein